MNKYRVKVYDRNLKKEREVIVKVDLLKGETLESKLPESFHMKYAERIEKKPGLLSRLRLKRRKR